MLIKLFKHEFKDTGKLLFPLNLALIGVTILGMIIIGLGLIKGDGFVATILTIALVLFYIIATVALFIITYIYLTVRFYRSMYSDEGYLTHTLPVSSFALFNTKMLVSVFWTFLTTLLMIASVFALVYSGMSAATDFTSADISLAISELENVMGISIISVIGWFLLLTFVSSVAGMLMIFCSCSIGQLFNKHKVGASILTYVIIYIVLQIINVIVAFSQGFHAGMDMVSSSNAPATIITIEEEMELMFNLYGDIFNSSILEYVILAVIYYVVCVYINHKKLNLD